MSDFKTKVHQNRFRPGLRPRSRSGYRKGGGGEGEEEEARVRKGRNGREGTPVCIFKFSLE